MVSGAEVAGHPPEVVQNRRGGAEPRPASADPDVEPVPQDDVRPPERNADNAHGRERQGRFAHPATTHQDEQALSRDDEHGVGVAREHREDSDSPEREPPPPARVERGEESQKREQAREEEEAVHPAVDPVEEQCPGAGRKQRRDDAGGRVDKAPTEQRDQRNARHREDERDHPQCGQPSAQVHDRPRESEVERCAAALEQHGPQHVAE